MDSHLGFGEHAYVKSVIAVLLSGDVDSDSALAALTARA